MSNPNTYRKVKFPKLTVVDFRKWSGKTRMQKHASKLLNTTSGLKCCLGFACTSAGLTDDEIAGPGWPSCLVSNDHVMLCKAVVKVRSIQDTYDDSKFSVAAIDYNDSASYSPAERIDLLYELFKKNKVSIAFSHVPKSVRYKVKNKEALKKN
jgi:hypothetical protein